MFMTKIESVPAVALVAGLVLGGIGPGVGRPADSVAVARQPKAQPTTERADKEKQPAADKPAAKTDVDRLQGEWKPVDAEIGGRTDPNLKELKKIRWVIKGDKITIGKGAGNDATGSVKVDTTKKPKEIDITLTAGGPPAGHKTSPGISKLDGDNLTVCYAFHPEDGQSRPTDFDTKDGAQLVVLVRAAQKKKSPAEKADKAPPKEAGPASPAVTKRDQKSKTAVLTIGAAPGNKAAPDQVARLIQQLGDDSFAKREAASKALETIGMPGFAALRKATANPDPEVRRRAARLLRAIAARLEVRTFTGHTDGVIAVALSHDGKRALSGPVCYTSKDSAARLWDVRTGKEVRRFDGHGSGVYAVAFSPDSKRAITGGDRNIRLWDVATGKELRRFEGHTDQVYAAVFSPDGKSVLSASIDQTVRLWDVETGKERKRFVGHTSAVRRVAFAPDGKRMLSRSVFTDPFCRLWDVKSGKESLRFSSVTNPSGTPGTVGIAFSPDGKLIAVGGQDNAVRLVDARTGKEVRRLTGHTGEVGPVVFTNDGKSLLSGSEDRTIRLWDVQSGEELCNLTGHTQRVWSIVCSRDGRYVLSGSFDRTLRLWHLPG